MARVLTALSLFAFVGFASAVPSTYPAFIIPAEHRSQVIPLKSVEELPLNGYEYTIVPADEYPVAEYVSESSIWDYIPLPNPIKAIATVASKVAVAGKFLIINGGLILLGAALVIGFCAFTPYCTIVIEKPFARQIRSLNLPYLDNVEDYLRQAYDKYHDL